MAINADKPTRWKADVAASIDLYNNWFLEFAPTAYRETRIKATGKVRLDLEHTAQMSRITPSVLMTYPDVLPTLRMSTAPPLARDRLMGLAHVSSNFIARLEVGKLPRRTSEPDLAAALDRICKVCSRLLDQDLFPWIGSGREPNEPEQYRSATVVADRLCGAVADPIIRNAQEARQLSLIGDYLKQNGYLQVSPNAHEVLFDMQPGTFAFRRNITVGQERSVNIPVDVVIQPQTLRPDRMPILIEAKSAGDFTNTNKRRKEEATKIRQLRDKYGGNVQMLLFLCGYFDSGYLGYEAAEGLDWVWEHRISDLALAGI